jgi:hypothetical protein
MKKWSLSLIAVVCVGWIGYRVGAIYSESRREVFNVARMEARPVSFIVVREETKALREPLFIKNNRAFVSGARVGKFGAGQSIGGGRIVSVSGRLDLDTGMYLIRTSGAADGEHLAERKYAGFFVPVHAVRGGRVMVAENGAAAAREVDIINRDSENVLIRRGLADGDIVVLSRVEEGDKLGIENREP